MDRSSGFWWSPDGARIAYQETDERHIPLYSIVHQGGEEISVETHRYPVRRRGQCEGPARRRLRRRRADPLADTRRTGEDFYLARVNWETPRTSLLVQVLSRDQKNLRLLRVDVESRRTTLLIEEKTETWVNLHDDLRVVEATGEIALVVRANRASATSNCTTATGSSSGR